MRKYKEIAITYKTLKNSTTDTIYIRTSKRVPLTSSYLKTLLPGESITIPANTFIKFKSNTKPVYLGNNMGNLCMSSRVMFEYSGTIAIDTTTPKYSEFKEYATIGGSTTSGTSRLSFNISKGSNMQYCVIGVLDMNNNQVYTLDLEGRSGTVELAVDFNVGTPLMLFLFTNNKSPTNSSVLICEQNYFTSFNIEGTTPAGSFTPAPYAQVQIMPGYSTVYFSCTTNRNTTGNQTSISGSGTGTLSTTDIAALISTIASSGILYYGIYRYDGAYSLLNVATITIHNPRSVTRYYYSEGLSLVWNTGVKEFTKITAYFNSLYPVTGSYMGGGAGGSSGSLA